MRFCRKKEERNVDDLTEESSILELYEIEEKPAMKQEEKVTEKEEEKFERMEEERKEESEEEEEEELTMKYEK